MSADRGDGGYATLLDGLLFLVLVSIGAALVAQTLPGAGGLRAAQESRSQKLDAAALESLLNTRQGDGRTLGERIGEALLARMAGEGGDPGLGGLLDATLARSLGPRERFNLTVAWRPVPWAAPEARVAAGPPAPPGAALAERDLALPTGRAVAEAPPGELPGPPLDRAAEAVRMELPRRASEAWAEDPLLRALAERALAQHLASGGSAEEWFDAQLRPNRARATLALWRV